MKKNSKAISSLDTSINRIQKDYDTGYRLAYTYYIHQFDSLEKVCLENNYKHGLGKIYFMRGSMERWMDNYDSALVWLTKSYSELRGGNTNEEIKTLLEVGDVYYNTGKKKFANEYYYRAMDISEKINSPEAKISTTSRLSTVLFHQNSFYDALVTYKKTLSYTRDANYKGEHNSIKLRVFNNIGVCYGRLEKYDSALIYYDSAMQQANILDSLRLSIAKGVIYGNMGRIHQQKGEYKMAVDLLKKNLSVNAFPDKDLGDAVTSITYLLEIYNTLDSSGPFIEKIDTAISYTFRVKNISMINWRIRLYGLKADFFAKQKQPALAYQYRTMQYFVSDSFNKATDHEDLQDVILFRQLKAQGDALIALEKDNKQQQLRIEIYLTLSVLVIILLIIATVGLNKYRKSLKRLKALNTQIAEQNQQINLNKNELEQAIEELKQLNIEKNRLLGMVAHDLRGPIYNITGVVQLLESSPQFDKMDASDVHLVELIKKSCDNALEVINDLLEAAKLENANFSYDMFDENLNEVVKNAIKLYESRAAQKQIKIYFAEPNQTVIAPISKEKMNRALGNLLSNAIKFSKHNTAIHIVLTKTDNKALLSVSDEGVGIPQADRKIIFDKFTTAKRVGTDGEKPVGLGMSIVKQIIEAHNGRVWLDSEVGAGTTFHIELPLKEE